VYFLLGPFSNDCSPAIFSGETWGSGSAAATIFLGLQLHGCFAFPPPRVTRELVASWLGVMSRILGFIVPLAIGLSLLVNNLTGKYLV